MRLCVGLFLATTTKDLIIHLYWSPHRHLALKTETKSAFAPRT